MQNKERYSNYSSSQAYRLVNPGKRKLTELEKEEIKRENPKSKVQFTNNLDTSDSTMKTYVKENIRERKLKRGIDNESNARPLIWGKIIERYVYAKKLDLSYESMNHNDRKFHDEIPKWCGLADTLRNKTIIGDIKSPYTLNSFCDKVEAMEKGLEALKNDVKEDYWQLISNSCLYKVNRAELIVFCPRISDFKELLEFVDNFDGDEELSPFQVKWVSDQLTAYMDYGELPQFPYLPNDSEYKSLNIFEFEVPEQDKIILTNRFKMAIELENKILNKKL